MIKRIIFLVSVVFFSLINISFAAVSANVDRTQVGLGESVKLTLKLDNINSSPNLAPLRKDFDIYGATTSSQTTVINGKVSENNAYIVTLLPKHIGKIIIPSIQIGSEKTNVIVINVVKTSAQQSRQSNQTIFVEASVPNGRVYVNTPLIYSIKLYFSQPITNVSMVPLKLVNASIKTLGKSKQYQTQKNGEMYHVIEQNFLITPDQSGVLNIPAARIQAAVLGQSRSSNNFFGMQQTQPVVVASDPIQVYVKSIPRNIKVKDWFPASSLKITDSWAGQLPQLIVGTPVTRTIIISAKGVEQSTFPELTFPSASDVNSYPDKPKFKTVVDHNGLPSTTAIYKIAYIPKKEGPIKFSAISVKWFDTTTNSEKIAKIHTRIIKVNPAPVTTGFLSSTQKNSSFNSLSVPQRNKRSKVDELTVNNKIKENRNHTWKVVSASFALVWLVTLFILFLLFRKYKKVVKQINKSKKSNQLLSDISTQADLKSTLKQVKQACDQKDLSALNVALIKWGELAFSKPIYSAMDMTRYLTDQDLKTSIKSVNSALYAQGEFSNYATLWQQIKSYQPKHLKGDEQEVLKPLYPH